MKLLFFSDSHGMADCLKKLFEHAEQLSADRLIFLGDALYHGPRNGVPDGYNPTETVTLFNANKDKILAVRGNCDADVDQMMLEFPVLCDRAEIRVYFRSEKFSNDFVVHFSDLSLLMRLIYS